ncbi:MAG: hypothetical protein IJ272_09785 [Clostridia bacterium]|nr:hypothetical protein [Clostridia bacterium]
MAKEMIYFNATKQIETITIHYNSKLDGTFVDGVAISIKDIAKKMSKVNLKNPREFDSIQVFVYPSKQLFYKVFAGEIEKRFYARRRSLEDLYVVQDAEGNIHIVSPRGMAQEKRDAFKKILVMKILGEYMEEKERQSAERLLREAMKPKEEEKEDIEEEEIEQDNEPDLDEEQESEELEQDDEELEEEQEEDLDEEDLEEIIETELVMEQIDEKQEAKQQDNEVEAEEPKEEKKESPRSEAQEWLSAGWLAYVKGKLKKAADIKRFADNISKNGVKKLGQLSQGKWYDAYNYSQEYACAWVECIISTYGMKKFLEYYENPKDIKRIFGVSKFIFESQVKAYIKEKYKYDEKVLNITEDIKLDNIVYGENQDKDKEDENTISELTQLRFSKSGRVAIEVIPSIEKQAPEIK